MSKFMDFLDNIQENNLISEHIEDIVEEQEEIVEFETEIEDEESIIETVTTQTKNKPVYKDVSVKLLESRIRLKLDDLGFGEKLIEDVISDVFSNVLTVSGYEPKDFMNNTKKKAPVQETTMIGRAESILSGLPDDGAYTPMLNNTPTMGGGSSLSSIADRASSIL